MMSLASLSSVWRYRGFVYSSVRREFASRYRGSMLGGLWAILNPLSLILVYTLVFSQLMRARLPGLDNSLAYSIYLCAGVLTWGYFSEIISRSQTMFIESGNLLKKVNFPRSCVPTVVMLSALLNFAIVFTLFLAFLAVTGNLPGPAVFAAVPVLGLVSLFALSLGVILGVLNVFFRDVGQLTGIVLQFWFWLTPIVYPLSIIPEHFVAVIEHNPMTAVIGALQTIFVYGDVPRWSQLISPTVITLCLSVLALLLFRRRAGEMVDEL